MFPFCNGSVFAASFIPSRFFIFLFLLQVLVPSCNRPGAKTHDAQTWSVLRPEPPTIANGNLLSPGDDFVVRSYSHCVAIAMLRKVEL